MKIHVSDLEGVALDWAVAKATCPQSFRNSCNDDGLPYWSEGWLLNGSPSTDWGQCGPLIDAHDVWLCHEFRNDEKLYTASTHLNSVHTYDTEIYEGRTAQVAICRAVVAVQLGEEVEIPDELVK